MSGIKNLLKNLKLHESAVSTILGFLVIVVVGLLVVNYFRNLDSTPPFPEAAQTENEEAPESYTVAAGDSLWSISEKVYGTGYNWVDIRDANDIENPNDIKEGQKLVIPKVETGKGLVTETIQLSPAPQETVVAVASPSPTPEAEIASGVTTPRDSEVTKPGGDYTVIRGDNLWNIAVSVYGDGYRWVDIARANNLANPSIIHAGNVLTIPA